MNQIELLLNLQKPIRNVTDSTNKTNTNVPLSDQPGFEQLLEHFTGHRQLSLTDLSATPFNSRPAGSVQVEATANQHSPLVSMQMIEQFLQEIDALELNERQNQLISTVLHQLEVLVGGDKRELSREESIEQQYLISEESYADQPNLILDERYAHQLDALERILHLLTGLKVLLQETPQSPLLETVVQLEEQVTKWKGELPKRSPPTQYYIDFTETGAENEPSYARPMGEGQRLQTYVPPVLLTSGEGEFQDISLRVFEEIKFDSPSKIAEPAASTERFNRLIEEIKAQFKSHFQLLKDDDTTQIRVKLHPEHLGHLDIRVTSLDGKITAHMMASTGAAKEVLELQVNQLRLALLQQNIQVDRIEITQQNNSPNLLQHQDDKEGGSFFQQKEQGGTFRQKKLDDEEFIDQFEDENQLYYKSEINYAV